MVWVLIDTLMPQYQMILSRPSLDMLWPVLDTSASYNAALSIIQLLYNADLDIKLETTRRVSIAFNHIN